MYIPPFWAGVIATMSTEIIALDALLAYVAIKARKKNDKEENKNDSPRINE